MTSLPPESPLRQQIDEQLRLAYNELALYGEVRWREDGSVLPRSEGQTYDEWTSRALVRELPSADEVCGILADDDTEPFDVTPDDCWRCDAIPATTPVGLCDACHHDLSEEPS